MGSVHPLPAGQKPPGRPRKTSPASSQRSNRATHEQPGLPNDETVERMVAEAAYYLAEKRNFEPGYEEADWLAAKEQIAEQFRQALNPIGRKSRPAKAHDKPRRALAPKPRAPKKK